MKAIFAIALLGLLAAIFFWERNNVDGLSAENQALHAEKREAAKLADENRELEGLRAATSTAPRNDRTELLRLRNEVRRLRAQQQEVEKLRTANQRAADEIKSGKFSPRRLSDMEGFVAREKWGFVGFATPEAAVQSFFAASLSGDLEQLFRCASPAAAEAMRRAAAKDPVRTQEQLELMRSKFSAASGFRIIEIHNESDDKAEVKVQFTADRNAVPLRFQRIGSEWKLDN